jgi:hypothetical protein
VARRANFPVALVPLSDVGPFTQLAVWRKDERDPVVLSAIALIQRHAAGAAEADGSAQELRTK